MLISFSPLGYTYWLRFLLLLLNGLIVCFDVLRQALLNLFIFSYFLLCSFIYSLKISLHLLIFCWRVAFVSETIFKFPLKFFSRLHFRRYAFLERFKHWLEKCSFDPQIQQMSKRKPIRWKIADLDIPWNRLLITLSIPKICINCSINFSSSC